MESVISKSVRKSGFTLVEVAAAMVLLGLLVGSTLTLINRYIDTVIDLRLREQAFEIARSNMERLLSENSLSDMDEFGTDEFIPDLDWETLVEPFYEPVTNRMWIRAVCSAGYTDRAGERQDVELEHWITNLTPEQIKKITEQQKIEDEYMDLLQGGELTDIQKATAAFMIQENMDIEAYKKFLKQQRKQKLEYMSEKGTEGYENFVQQLEDEENIFLQKLGLNFDSYNEFVKGFDPSTFNADNFLDDAGQAQSDSSNPASDTGAQDSSQPSETTDPAKSNPADSSMPTDIPPELQQLLDEAGIKK